MTTQVTRSIANPARHTGPKAVEGNILSLGGNGWTPSSTLTVKVTIKGHGLIITFENSAVVVGADGSWTAKWTRSADVPAHKNFSAYVNVARKGVPTEWLEKTCSFSFSA
jgi:hypothetical protein